MPSAPILVVEDDPDVRDAMSEVLEAEGYEVATAAEGQQALDRMRGPSRPCLVLLDLMLPVMDGFEVRVRQLQDPALATIPVIVFSGGSDLAQKAAGVHPVACFSKPVDIPQLLAFISARVPKPRPVSGWRRRRGRALRSARGPARRPARRE